MYITEIRLILQRDATLKELKDYEELQRVFDGLSPKARARRGIRRPADLGLKGERGKKVVHYKSSNVPMYEESYVKRGVLKIGISGAKFRFKQIVATMLSQYVRPDHKSFYVLGQIAEKEAENFRPVGFRTFTARTLL